MFTIAIKLKKEDESAIRRMPKEFKLGLDKGIRNAMLYAEKKARRRFNTAGNLKVRTGHYRRSIRSGILPSPSGVIGYLAADVVYASVHERPKGEKLVIKAKGGGYMRFPIKGRWVSVKQVVIPGRPLLTPSITENLRVIDDIIVQDIVKEMGV